MGSVISKEKIEGFLKKDGDIFYLIDQKEQTELKRILFANKTNWTKISNLPEQVVWYRLHEHAFADEEFADIIQRYDVEKMIEDYRSNEHYTDSVA